MIEPLSGLRAQVAANVMAAPCGLLFTEIILFLFI